MVFCKGNIILFGSATYDKSYSDVSPARVIHIHTYIYTYIYIKYHCRTIFVVFETSMQGLGT